MAGGYRKPQGPDNSEAMSGHECIPSYVRPTSALREPVSQAARSHSADNPSSPALLLYVLFVQMDDEAPADLRLVYSELLKGEWGRIRGRFD
jgi:hypothetical protein